MKKTYIMVLALVLFYSLAGLASQVQIHLRLAQEYHRNKHYTAAVDEYEKVLDIDPGNVDVHRQFIRACVDGNMGTIAIEKYEMKRALDPNNAIPYHAMGYCYHKMGQYDMAIEHFEKAIEIDRHLLGSYVCLGDIYSYQKKFAKAEEIVKRALQLDQNCVAAHVALGSIYAGQSRYEKAIVEFNIVRELEPDGSYTAKAKRLIKSTTAKLIKANWDRKSEAKMFSTKVITLAGSTTMFLLIILSLAYFFFMPKDSSIRFLQNPYSKKRRQEDKSISMITLNVALSLLVGGSIFFFLVKIYIGMFSFLIVAIGILYISLFLSLSGYTKMPHRKCDIPKR